MLTSPCILRTLWTNKIWTIMFQICIDFKKSWEEEGHLMQMRPLQMRWKNVQQKLSREKNKANLKLKLNENIWKCWFRFNVQPYSYLIHKFIFYLWNVISNAINIILVLKINFENFQEQDLTPWHRFSKQSNQFQCCINKTCWLN